MPVYSAIAELAVEEKKEVGTFAALVENLLLCIREKEDENQGFASHSATSLCALAVQQGYCQKRPLKR